MTVTQNCQAIVKVKNFALLVYIAHFLCRNPNPLLQPITHCLSLSLLTRHTNLTTALTIAMPRQPYYMTLPPGVNHNKAKIKYDKAKAARERNKGTKASTAAQRTPNGRRAKVPSAVKRPSTTSKLTLTKSGRRRYRPGSKYLQQPLQ